MSKLSLEWRIRPTGSVLWGLGLFSETIDTQLGFSMADTPQENTSNEFSNGGRKDFFNVDTVELKQIYKDSQTLTTLYVLWTISLALIVAALICMWFGTPAEDKPVAKVASLFFIPVLLLKIPAIIGTYRRTRWVCTLGFVISVFMIPAFPIGTVLGFAGVKAYQREYLFGPEKISHADIKSEYLYRKTNRIS